MDPIKKLARRDLQTTKVLSQPLSDETLSSTDEILSALDNSIDSVEGNSKKKLKFPNILTMLIYVIRLFGESCLSEQQILLANFARACQVIHEYANRDQGEVEKCSIGSCGEAHLCVPTAMVIKLSSSSMFEKKCIKDDCTWSGRRLLRCIKKKVKRTDPDGAHDESIDHIALAASKLKEGILVTPTPKDMDAVSKLLSALRLKMYDGGSASLGGGDNLPMDNVYDFLHRILQLIKNTTPGLTLKDQLTFLHQCAQASTILHPLVFFCRTHRDKLLQSVLIRCRNPSRLPAREHRDTFLQSVLFRCRIPSRLPA